MTTAEAGEQTSTSGSQYAEHEAPIIGLQGCKLIQQGAEAVRPQQCSLNL